MFLTRRSFLATGSAAALSACADARISETNVVQQAEIPKVAPERDWRGHFDNLSAGAILVSLNDRRLAYWGPGDSLYREFPIAVPRDDDLQRTGRTEIVRKRENPDWRPTPNMLAKDPTLPAYVPPGPENPMGERALYLGWTYYAIHGTNNDISIGRRTTAGCIRLFNEHIRWLYDHAGIGTQVVVTG